MEKRDSIHRVYRSTNDFAYEYSRLRPLGWRVDSVKLIKEDAAGGKIFRAEFKKYKVGVEVWDDYEVLNFRKHGCYSSPRRAQGGKNG